MRKFLKRITRGALRAVTTAQTANRSHGFTLIELALAIFVLSLGTLAAIRASDQSRLAIGGETPRLLARIAARNRAEELQLYGMNALALPTEVTLGGQNFQINTQQDTTAGGLIKAVITARSDHGAGAQLVLYLSPEPRQ